MYEYHKINSLFKRDMTQKHKPFLEGEWSAPEFEYLANCSWDFTEKIDGTNIRVMYDGEKVTFGGRTDDAQIPAKLLERLQERFTTSNSMLPTVFNTATPDQPAVMYGEGYGAKIQKVGGNYRQDQDFILFDVRFGRWWLERDSVNHIAESLGLDSVPSLGKGTLWEAVEWARKGIQSTFGDFEAEGIIAVPSIPMLARSGSRIITKVKCKDFIK